MRKAQEGQVAPESLRADQPAGVGASRGRDRYPRLPETLEQAMACGNAAVAVAAIEQGGRALLGAVSAAGHTPLGAAVRCAAVEATEALLALGADPNEEVSPVRNDGSMPLHEAVLAGEPRLVPVLIEAGAVVDTLDANRMTPLGYTLVAQQRGAEIARALMRAGARVEARCGAHCSVLHYAVYMGRGPLVDALLEEGADPNLASKGGVSVLMQAAERGSREIVAALLAAGANAGKRFVDGRGAEDFARANGYAEIAEMIGSAARRKHMRVGLHPSDEQAPGGPSL